MIAVPPCQCLWTWECLCLLGKGYSAVTSLVLSVVVTLDWIFRPPYVGSISMGWAQMQMKMRVVLKGLRRTVCRAMSLQGSTSRTVLSFDLLHAELVYLRVDFENKCFFVYVFFFKVKTMIEQEVKNGIPSHRIILGGFSQVSTARTLMIADGPHLRSYSRSRLKI